MCSHFKMSLSPYAVMLLLLSLRPDPIPPFTCVWAICLRPARPKWVSRPPPHVLPIERDPPLAGLDRLGDLCLLVGLPLVHGSAHLESWVLLESQLLDRVLAVICVRRLQRLFLRHCSHSYVHWGKIRWAWNIGDGLMGCNSVTFCRRLINRHCCELCGVCSSFWCCSSSSTCFVWS